MAESNILEGLTEESFMDKDATEQDAKGEDSLEEDNMDEEDFDDEKGVVKKGDTMEEVCTTATGTVDGTSLALPDKNEFRSITLINIGARFKNNNDATVEWCRKYGLLATRMKCTKCNTNCKKGPYNRAIEPQAWRCNNRNCRFRMNIRKGSFFELSHLNLWQVLGVTYIWCTNSGICKGTSQADMMLMETEIGTRRSVSKWIQFCYDIPVMYFQKHRQQLGGLDKIVVIDKSLIAKIKHNPTEDEKFIFGAYEPATNNSVLIPVASHKTHALFPIIQEWIAPCSIIWSENWTKYRKIQKNTTDQTRTFVEPVKQPVKSGTDHFEWKQTKETLDYMIGNSKNLLTEDMLAAVLWNRKFGDSAFYHFWHQIASKFFVVNSISTQE